MTDEISVIIPLLNKGPHIARAINSVLFQSIQSFEIIVIDGGSTDEGPSIVKKNIDPRIKFFIQSRKGVSQARNEAVNLVKNDFIAFLDADDEWEPDHLETLLILKTKYPEAGLYADRFTIKKESENLVKLDNPFMNIQDGNGKILRYFLVAAISEPITTSAVGMFKKIYYEMDGFPEGVPFGEDMVLWGKIALKYPIAYSAKIGVIYHFDAMNRASEIKDFYYYPYPFIEIAKKAISNDKMTEEQRSDLREYISKKELNRAQHFIEISDFKKAKEILTTIETIFFKIDKRKFELLILLPLPIIKNLKKITTWLRIER
jgi:glycosyltransferase involved in cell wall biosynthesis